MNLALRAKPLAYIDAGVPRVTYRLVTSGDKHVELRIMLWSVRQVFGRVYLDYFMGPVERGPLVDRLGGPQPSPCWGPTWFVPSCP